MHGKIVACLSTLAGKESRLKFQEPPRKPGYIATFLLLWVALVCSYISLKEERYFLATEPLKIQDTPPFSREFPSQHFGYFFPLNHSLTKIINP